MELGYSMVFAGKDFMQGHYVGCYCGVLAKKRRKRKRVNRNIPLRSSSPPISSHLNVKALESLTQKLSHMPGYRVIGFVALALGCALGLAYTCYPS